MHPSGMTWERWNWPFKTPEERLLVMRYLYPPDEFDDSIPF